MSDFYTNNCPLCSKQLSILETDQETNCDCGAYLEVEIMKNSTGSKYMDLHIIRSYKPVDCPFCGESDFDKPGLKYHLNYCNEFQATEDI